jgi:hypothetical protein
MTTMLLRIGVSAGQEDGGQAEQSLGVRLPLVDVVRPGPHDQRHDHAREHATQQEFVDHSRQHVGQVVVVRNEPRPDGGPDRGRAEVAGDPTDDAGHRHDRAVLRHGRACLLGRARPVGLVGRLDDDLFGRDGAWIPQRARPGVGGDHGDDVRFVRLLACGRHDDGGVRIVCPSLACSVAHGTNLMRSRGDPG